MTDEPGNGLFTVTPFRRLASIHQLSSKSAENAPAITDGRPMIRLEVGNLEQAVDQAEAALIASGRGLYQRADKIVAVGTATRITHDKREVPVTRIFERGEHALLEDLTAAAAFEKWDGRSRAFVLTEAPAKIVKVLRERTGRLRFPPLEGVVSAPTLRPDGSLLSDPGYDPSTGLLFVPGETTFPPIAEAPSRQDAEAALDKLKGLITTFPFVGEADRSVALSALQTSCSRRALRTAPMHAFTAPVAGSGKSMLVDLASILATGREAGVIAQGKSEEETEKRLGSILLTGDQVMAIDNVEHPLGGEALCQLLTQPTVRVRILGRSEAPELPTGVLVTATGNNLTLVGDMTRRALLCSLDPKEEQPESRVFAANPIADAKANRGEYVAAALTVLRAYITAGKPRQANPLGSFEQWSDLVRSALLWLGCADPVATLEAARARDPRLDELHAVMSQWAAVIGEERTTVRNVIAKATEKTAPNAFDFHKQASESAFVKPDFREALLAVAGQGGAINGRRLGHWLSKQKGRIVSVTIDPGEHEGSEFPPPQTVAKRYFRPGPLRDGFATWISGIKWIISYPSREETNKQNTNGPKLTHFIPLIHFRQRASIVAGKSARRCRPALLDRFIVSGVAVEIDQRILARRPSGARPELSDPCPAAPAASVRLFP